MLNISPIGRNCDREERDAFETFDLVGGMRCSLSPATCLAARFARLLGHLLAWPTPAAAA